MTIQYYGQPFVFRANYADFKYITDPNADKFGDRFEFFANDQLTYDSANEQYSIDENRDGLVDYSFDDPDFSFIQFRSNLVFRWEYVAGSELFLVWTQSNSNFGNPQDDLFESLKNGLFDNTPHNIFLIKPPIALDFDALPMRLLQLIIS